MSGEHSQRRKKQEAETRPPVFSCSRSSAPVPARKCESVSGSHQSDGNSHGDQLSPYRQPVGGELPWSGTNLWPRLMPSRRQPPSVRPWRATELPTPQQSHFQYKKPLAQFSCIGYNVLAKQQEQKRQGVKYCSTPRPYAGGRVKPKSHTAEIICAQSPL